jgi:heat shock protein HtpX
LFTEIERICWRAKLHRRPQIFVLVGQRAMNAYASGSTDDAVVIFTEGLLMGMGTQEVGAIFAHEIAHICNGDGFTMSWAADLQRAINDVSTAALASTPSYGAGKPHQALHWLLERAPAIAELLMLALSRCREIEADALALDFTGDAKTLERALGKLEQHHRALGGIPESYVEDQLASYLRSHPPTAERISHLRAFEAYAVS